MDSAQGCLTSHRCDLPEDVARIVFEMAAREDRRNASQVLSVVCKRVQLWIDPVIYSTVLLTSGHQVTSFASSISSKGVPFVRSAVRSLSLPGYVWTIQDSILTILTACTGVTSLYWDLVTNPHEHRVPILRALESLPLHTLYLRVNYFIDFSDPDRKPVKLHPKLTCLGIIDNWATWHSLFVGDPLPTFLPSSLAQLHYLILRVGNPRAGSSVSQHNRESAHFFRTRGIGSCRDPRLVVIEQDLTRAVWERQLLDGNGDLLNIWEGIVKSRRDLRQSDT